MMKRENILMNILILESCADVYQQRVAILECFGIVIAFLMDMLSEESIMKLKIRGIEQMLTNLINSSTERSVKSGIKCLEVGTLII